MTNELEQLADRHLRPDPHGALGDADGVRQARILLAIDSATAATKAGQDALWMLANLLSRQFRLVTAVSLDIPPDVRLLPRVAAFGGAPTLGEAISNCIRLIAGDHVTVDAYPGQESEAYPIEIFVGWPDGVARAALRLVVVADGWRLFVGRACRRADLPCSALNFGPYLAACFAAGEVFKRLRSIKPGRGELIGDNRDLCLSLWTGRQAASWDQLDPDPDIRQLTFPPLYFAGAGAVAQAAALALAGLPDATGHMTVIDPEALDLSNDNRYVLATRDDDCKPKAAFMADFLSARGFTEYHHPGTWQDYVTRRNRLPNRADLDDLEHQFKYRLVLSCVDDNNARHATQNLWPEMIIGGSTHGLTAKAIIYDMAGDQLCLKCYNPVADRNVLVRQRLDEARAMDPQRRAKFFADLGVDPAKAEQHLRDPRCGQLTEQDLDRFAAGDPMMSVGFVSVAAGVLLAARLLRYINFGRESRLVQNGPMLIANFYRPALRWLLSRSEAGCDCAQRRKTDWLARWPKDA